MDERGLEVTSNHEMSMTGLGLGRLGFSPNEIEAEPNAMVKTEPHARKKISWRDKILGKNMGVHRSVRGRRSNGLFGRLGR